MSTAVLDNDVIEEVTYNTSNEPGKCSHIVKVPEDRKDELSPQALVVEARVMGFELEALCGYKWIPKQDPLPLPVCDICLEVYKTMLKDKDEFNKLPDV